ncbi:MAG: TIGR00269 family protein [Methanomassiliicoccales archaeon]
MKCSRCKEEAVTFIRYNGSHLCHRHFVEYVEKRVKKEIRKQVDLNGKEVMAVGLSGGKDSSVALVILSKILEERRGTELHAITVDEGIKGYRPPSLECASRLCSELDVRHHLVSFRQEFDLDMDEMAPLAGERTPCTYCGVLRRNCLNRVARSIGADLVATGLNLDDTAQSILMNFTRGDVERLARMGPHPTIQPGLVPRIQPLRVVPEKESYLYAMLEGIDFSDLECPYADPALRNDYREMVDGMERRSPGIRFSILSSQDEIAPLMRRSYPPASLNRCTCGEPCIDDRCQACQLLQGLRLRRTRDTRRPHSSRSSSTSPG